MILVFKADVIYRGKEVIEELQDLIWIGKEMKSKGEGKKNKWGWGGQLFLMLVDSSVGHCSQPAFRHSSVICPVLRILLINKPSRTTLQPDNHKGMEPYMSDL